MSRGGKPAGGGGHPWREPAGGGGGGDDGAIWVMAAGSGWNPPSGGIASPGAQTACPQTLQNCAPGCTGWPHAGPHELPKPTTDSLLKVPSRLLQIPALANRNVTSRRIVRAYGRFGAERDATG